MNDIKNKSFNRRIRLFLTSVFILFVATALVVAYNLSGFDLGSLTKSGQLRVYFIDVGQGDCTLFVLDDISIIIDCGESEYADYVIYKAKSYGVTEFTCVIGSHPHSDHIGGMGEILSEIPAETVLIPQVDEEYITTSLYYDFIDAAQNCGASISYAYAGDIYEFGPLSVEIFSPTETDSDLNNASIVCRISYNDVSFLLTGDVETDAEEILLENFSDISCTVLKVAHHGSKYSSCEEFITAASPTYAVIEVGAYNLYGHPTDETLEKLINIGALVYRTDEDGTIIMYTDGYSITVETEK